MFLFCSISVAKRLERVAIEYNQMQYLVTKGASLPFVTNIDWVGHFSDLDVFAQTSLSFATLYSHFHPMY